MIATITQITKASQLLETTAAAIIERTPIRIVRSQPIGSRPGRSRRRAAPTMANEIRWIHLMGASRPWRVLGVR